LRKGLEFTVTVEDEEVRRNLERLDEGMMAAVRAGLAQAMNAMMKDIVVEIPETPILTSALRGSITTFVNNVLVGVSNYGIPKYQQLKSTEPEYRKGMEGLLVVNAPYATVQHEMFPHKSKPGAGMYYVSSKVRMFGEKYVGMVVNVMRKVRGRPSRWGRHWGPGHHGEVGMEEGSAKGIFQIHRGQCR